MELKKAKILTVELIRTLSPYCKRIEVAGSIRREVSEVRDIELVAIADKWKLEKYFMDNKKLYFFNKNGAKYKQFIYGFVNVDLFICNEDNWGLLFLIRTGSAEFSQRMLARWKKVSQGGYSENGYLHDREGKKIITESEKKVFELLQMKFINPEERI